MAKLSFISLMALAFACFLGKAYESSLRGIDSNIHAEVSMNVTANGLKPQLPMPYQMAEQGAVPVFNDHPFFFFWLNGWVMRAFGPSAWSARLLTATFAAGCIALTFWLGVLWRSVPFGLLSALLLLFCRDFILTGATVSMDMPLVFFILLSFVFWQKKQWTWVGVAAGIGLWIKTPVVLLVYPTAFLYELIQGKLKKTLLPLLASASLALGLGSLVWVVLGIQGGWHWVADYWQRQVWGTAVSGRGLGFERDWGLFFYTIRTGFVPGLLFLIFGMVQIGKKRLWKTLPVLVSLIVLFLVGTSITLLRFKMGHYYNPIFPFLAFLASYSVIDSLEKRANAFYLGVNGATPLLLSFLLVTPVSLGPEAFVALKRFEPLIQTYGRCSDPIYLIPGGEPVGGQLDYKLHLSFYTGRKSQVMDCGKFRELVLNRPAPIGGWLIVSEENRAQCLHSEDRKRFTAAFRMGNQFLFTDRISFRDEIVDLSALEREDLPVRECSPAPIPNDRYHIGF